MKSEWESNAFGRIFNKYLWNRLKISCHSMFGKIGVKMKLEILNICIPINSSDKIFCF